jgi:hypothetical protein
MAGRVCAGVVYEVVLLPLPLALALVLVNVLGFDDPTLKVFVGDVENTKLGSIVVG